MASTERSMGWATSGTGDGPLAGYDSSRWRANAQKSDGTGVMLYGSYMAMSGATTSTLTIADGAALISGYTYETNGSVTISTSGLTGTYSVVIVANNSAGALTVSANGAGTTTVAVSTIRVALVTAAQLTTIQGAVGASLTLTIGTVVTAAGVISTITPAYPYTSTLSYAPQVYGILDGSPSLNIPNNTGTTITGYSTFISSGEGIISGNTSTGVITVALSGLYQYDVRCVWDSNTTGNRSIVLSSSSTSYLDGYYTSASAAVIPGPGNAQVLSGIISLGANATVNIAVSQNSGSARTVTLANLKLVRL